MKELTKHQVWPSVAPDLLVFSKRRLLGQCYPSSAATPCPHLPPLGDEIRDLEMVPDSMLHSSSERPTFIDRLANSLTKRKRSTPQKFVGKSPVIEETSDLSHSSSVSEL